MSLAMLLTDLSCHNRNPGDNKSKEKLIMLLKTKTIWVVLFLVVSLILAACDSGNISGKGIHSDNDLDISDGDIDLGP